MEVKTRPTLRETFPSVECHLDKSPTSVWLLTFLSLFLASHFIVILISFLRLWPSQLLVFKNQENISRCLDIGLVKEEHYELS